MANKYSNLVGTNKIKDEYTKINIGFEKVETDINAVNSRVDTVDARVDTIITTPIEGAAAAQEIVDARVSAVKSKAFATLDARFEETEQDVESHMADFVSLKNFGATGDGVTDDTINFQTAVDNSYNKTLIIPKGTFIISTVDILDNITFLFLEGAVVKRKGGLDITQSIWNDGTAMFEAKADGITVKFMGTPTFDGNKQNQPVKSINPLMEGATTEPVGWSFKYKPIDLENTADSVFIFENALFINGTMGYVLVRGCNVNREFKTRVILNNVSMKDTVLGYGANDPATPTALGWNSDYISVLDYVELNTYNLDLKYEAGVTTTGQYAPVGIRATYYGSDYNMSGESILILNGTTTLYGLGRKANAYNNDTVFNNNAIGAIDVYGNGESLYIENVVAENCEMASVRAKASIKRFTVKNAYIKNCRHGVKVSTSSTGVPEAEIYLGNILCEGGVNPQLSFGGNSLTEKIKSVYIENAIIKGGVNSEGAADAYIGGVFLRYCDSVTINNIIIEDQDNAGLNTMELTDITINNIKTKGTVKEGLILNTLSGSIAVKSGSISNVTGDNGLKVSGVPVNVSFEKINVDGALDYGFNISTDSTHNTVRDCCVSNVSGVSRGYYFKTQGLIDNSIIGACVTTKLWGAAVTER